MNFQPVPDTGFLSEEAFIQRLHLEQRRTERSRRPFVFMLIESSLLQTERKNGWRRSILKVISGSVRETDIRGWYEDGAAIGLIFTEIGREDGHAIGTQLVEKIQGLLTAQLGGEIGKVQFSFFVFPEDWDKGRETMLGTLYPDSVRQRRVAQVIKRIIDIGGSLAAIALASPLILAIAAAITLTSPGPILFRQQRVGRYGRKFSFLKFRSMYVNNDSAIHQKFVTEMIAGVSNGGTNQPPKKVYKITNDRRVTPVGRLLRKTSMDELPQFVNVLKGEMSLVGPRPPIPYEVDIYDIWHRRRLLAVKPGITGLWQVHGRCRTTFDEMVRLDLQYAKSWSVWLDLKILLQTPRAVIAGDGAY